ncbi:DUF485 domain-containing protein [Cryobacterium psychrophilum]|uniref:DUF485 domain-containing protein n=1 Tax=Cryobacterium psychrophilum TaxID=41988 RepID=A0A4Y8KKG8_9MICO|nr:DUF485 domain-containing protein [Cryobacterium psychrophilum]TDW29244.1 uncharacterized membrane protein (DUF485 family) [Cryobacterium psychrophilum]TFD74682.1 DUF485 domain-containing protein [Cryobacterium psychrophilum]
MSEQLKDASPQSQIDYIAFEKTARFKALKKTRNGFVVPLSAFFLLWYFAYVLAAGYFPEFMATPVFGRINLGLILGLGQFVTTFVITMAYVTFANRKIDPLTEDLRSELERMEKA